jgi:hypothetical protein
MSETSPKVRVYCLDTDEAGNRDPIARSMITTFLTAHDIDPMLFMVGTSFNVYRHADGTFWLETWQARPEWPLCETCPGCALQDRVEKPLVAPVPIVAGASLFSLDGEGPDFVEPENALAAAESAYRAALEQHAIDVGNSSRMVSRRREELDCVRLSSPAEVTQ